ncbi:MAG TPA: farnesyl diphosphate synthase [Vicinamibacterales bacterium]|nr:farnesyl diphosphate synthase [Vicinamibacterales bacterium]
MTDATAVADYVRARRAEIEAALAILLPAPPDCPAPVADAMRYSLLGGGKRVRPVLCLASADAVGGRTAAVLQAACAIELIHTYSLIHDDLPAMDDDSLRRGRPTLHVVAGEGMAILAGDGLLTEAFHALSSLPGDAARVLRAVRSIAYAAGPVGMVGGQAIDLASVKPGPQGRTAALDATALATMHAKKTGALIRAAAAVGAVLGGGSEAQIAAIDGAGAEFGLAFQIVDDILDVEGESAQIGKTPGKDAAAGKTTYPALYGVDQSRAMAEACIARAADGLASAGMSGSWLLGIGRWIVERRN